MPQYTMFKIDISTEENINQFVEYVQKKYPFKDVVSTSLPIKISKHYHEGPESRLFLEGSACFVFENETVECGLGTYMELDPGLAHSFYSEGSFKVIRFNTEYENWRAIDVE